MKYLKYLLIALLLAMFLYPTNTKALEEPINIYVFYSSTCSSCKNANEFFNTYQKENQDVQVFHYEISDSGKEITKAEKVLKKNFYTVPWIIIGNKSFTGWMNSNSPSLIASAVQYYRNNNDKYVDVLGIELGITKPKDNQNIDDNSDDTNHNIKVPIFGNVNIKDFSLPIISIFLGAIDGFNPCAMWVLLFLVTMLLGMKDRKRMWILGIAFLLTSTLVYLLFMVSWLKIMSYASSLIFMRILISLVALIGGGLNIKNYFDKKNKDGCTVVDAKKRKNIFNRVTKLTTQNKFYLALFGIITLAITVNMVELACSLGIPVIFMQILNSNNLNGFEYSLYLGLYLFAFMLDDLIIFIISMLTLNVTSISTKYGKYTHLIGGVIMILIGILLVFRPEWLSFNFK